MPQTPEERRAYQRAYRAANKERLKALDQAKYERNKEKIKAQAREYYSAHREEVLAYKKEYHAEHKDEIYAKRATYNIDQDRKRATQHAWYEANAEHMYAYRQAYYQEHKEQFLANTRTNYAKDPLRFQEYRRARTARKKGAPINDLTAAQWETIKAAYGHRCVYCGRKMQRLTQDHIIPLSKGGNHTVQNIVPACRSCNSKKGAKAPLVPVQPLLLA